MTNPTPEAVKAAELVNAVRAERKLNVGAGAQIRDYEQSSNWEPGVAFARYIRDVSDAVKALDNAMGLAAVTRSYTVYHRLLEFVLPKPESDPLVEALKQFATLENIEQEAAADIRKNLDAAGYTITRKKAQ